MIKRIAIGAITGLLLTNMTIDSFARVSKIDRNRNPENPINVEHTKLSDMPTERGKASSVVIDKKIYVLGGENETSDYLKSMEIYDTQTDTWEKLSNMPNPLVNMGIGIYNENIITVGSEYDAGSYGRTINTYNYKSRIWEKGDIGISFPLIAMGEDVYFDFESELIDNKMYFFGIQIRSPFKHYKYAIDISKTDENGKYIGVQLEKTAVAGGDRDASETLDKNIFFFNSFDGRVDIYNSENDTWSYGSHVPTPREYMTTAVYNNSIYCIGGITKDGAYSNKIEIYNPTTDSWSTGPEINDGKAGISASFVDNTLYLIGGFNNKGYLNEVESISLQYYECIKAVEEAEQSKNQVDIETARDLVNQLPESSEKDQLQDRLNAIYPNATMEKEIATSNVDIYIKSANSLSLSLDTNSVSFDNFSGAENMERLNAVNLIINSSLPYKINAYMPTEIAGGKIGNTMDKSILNIKANKESTYQMFTDLITSITLLDNQTPGNNTSHGIDLMLRGGIAHEKDVYKATIKFEVQQK